MEKPCQPFHGEYQEGCNVCRKWRDNPKYREAKHTAPVPPIARSTNRERVSAPSDREIAPGIVARVRKAGCSEGCWRWTVLQDGRPTESGKAKTEEQAWSAAIDEARQMTGAAEATVAPVIKSRQTFEWVRTSDLARDAVLLAGLMPPDCSGIVGIPRSGMIPAAIVSSILHLPLYELTPSGQLHECGTGVRGRTTVKAIGPLAVVDDTVYSGAAMRRVKKQLEGRNVVTSAVYVETKAQRHVDLFARVLPCPHLLEWNLFNCGVSWGNAVNPVFGRGVATDLDGVICHDATSGGRMGAPYLMPRMGAIPLIATGRPEKTRPQTEAWLRQNRVKYARLAMLSDGADHTSASVMAAFKAKEFVASGCGFFVESEPEQAEQIARLSQRPVICPRAGKVF